MDKAFFQRKMDTRFNNLDSDGDGVITKADFERMADQVLEGLGLTRESAQGKAVLNGAATFWNGLADAADVDRDAKVTSDEFVTATTETMLRTPLGFDQIVRPFIESAAKAADTDGDGQLKKDEYERLLSALGVKDDALPDAAAYLANGDGSISLLAVIESTQQYYTSDTAYHPATYSFGKF